MSIKQILVPLTGESKAEHVCNLAFDIAVRSGAHVIGTDTVADPGPFLDQSGVGMMAAYYDELFKSAEKVQTQKRSNAAQAFEAARGKHGASASWVSGVDYNGQTVSLFGRLVDLIVVNQPGATASFAEMQVFETAVFTARRPVLVVLAAAKALGRRAAIAWNGSVEACGAVEGALDLLSGLDGVDIIQVGDIKAGNATAQSLVDYLERHGIAARIRTVADKSGSTAKLIAAEAKAAGASFMVMGGYTHSTLRELILGGVTQHMIGYSEMPVVMAH
jgi:nucleotide-binding universal stress UspA family protein